MSSSPSSSASSVSATPVVAAHRNHHANSNHHHTAADLINNNCSTNTSSPTKNKLNNLINLVEEDRTNCKRIKLSQSIENLTSVKNNKIEIDQEQALPVTNNKFEQQVQDNSNQYHNHNSNQAASANSTAPTGVAHNHLVTLNSTQTNMSSTPSNHLSNQHSDIDEGLYSRQLYVLGHEAMRRMQASNVLICGMGGLGVEIAKNVVLAGVKSVTIYDTCNVSYDDLSTQFFLHENDIGKNRALCTQPLLAELNTYVPVQVLPGNRLISCQDLNQFQVVVLTQSSIQEQLEFGEYCHQHDIKFIVAETRGIFGQIFCDFGSNFEVVDTDGEQALSAMISAINSDSQGCVTTLDEQRHGFEDDMYVTFSEVKGMTEVNGAEFKIKVLGPYTFSIGDTTNFNKYIRGGYVHQVKKPKTINFKSINEAIKQPETLISDFCKMDDSNTISLAFQTMSDFKQKFSHLPRPWHSDDANEFVKLAYELNEAKYKYENVSEHILRLFSSTSSGQLSPMQAVIGGTAAQEVMKACSGKFTPIFQFLFFDCRECLPEKPFEHLNYQLCSLSESESHLNRYKSQIAVFGKEFQKKLASSKYFIVGAGALGCEYLKNFAMLGMCTKQENGVLYITDMDTIEKSNLNRQFLFRAHDVQKSKSTVAAAASQKMNPNINIVAHTNRVCAETEQIYDDAFFEGIDGVCNALDNIDARVYMDRRCVYYHKPLIESGTLGTKGNVQVVIPWLTESYSSTQDPPEKSIPICTLRNFPNAIEHTLQWARDMFEGIFTNPATAAIDYIKDQDSYIQRLMKLQGSQPYEELFKVYKALVEDKPNSFYDCVKWARLHFQELYHDSIEQLLYNFPPDQKTSSGVPFWSGPKRCPHSLKFSTENLTHVDYVFAAANLKAEMYGIAQVRDRTKLIELINKVEVPVFKPKQGVKIHTNDAEAQNAMNNSNYEGENIDDLINKIKKIADLSNSKLNPVEFEKDDDNNLHMDFIVACSNLRAENYDITTADRHKSKLIAGRIIPAIATTTSLIVGLDCIELYKLMQGHSKIELYKSSFVNLALPFFGLSEPMPPKKSKYYDIEFSLWSRFEVDGELTLKEFMDYFKEKHSLEITMLSQGVVMLYSFFMDKKKLKERLEMPLSKVVESVTKKEIPAHVHALVLEFCCNDSDGNDLEVPYVKYNLPKKL